MSERPVEQLQQLGDTASRAARALRELGKVYQAGVDRDVAAHPDLAELNVKLDGFYGDT